MSVSHWLDSSAERPLETCDIAIVGAGLAGASVAYWLRGSRYKTLLVEAREPAAGASGRNAGFLTTGLSEYYNRVADLVGRGEARLIWDFIHVNHELLKRELFSDADTASRCGYDPCGGILAACSEREFLELRSAGRLLKEDGFPVEIWEPSEANERLRSRAFHGALHHPADARVNPAALTREILSRAGASVLAPREVHRLDLDSNRRVVLRTNAGDIRAEMVVLAAGSGLALLHPYFADKVRPVRRQFFVTEPIGERSASGGGVVLADFGRECFTRLPDGRVLMGGLLERGKKADAGHSEEPNPEIQDVLFRSLTEKFPALREAKISHRWACVEGHSRDFLPFAGALPWAPNVMFLGGFTGQDLGFAFHLGKVLAETVLHGKHPGIFSAERFAEQG